MKISFYSQMVGGFNPSEKYEFVSWDDEIPNKTTSQKKSKTCFMIFMGIKIEIS